MKRLLGTAAILGAGFLALPGAANAGALADSASLAAQASGSTVQQIDFKPFRHCHGPRWDRRCHGGGLFFFRDRDHRRDYDRDRRHHRRDRDRDRDRY
jgi:hypothetical protein